jgi:thiol-disulfide isomerase/thioredoxin
MLKYVEIDRNMKRCLTIVILITIILTGCRTSKPAAENKSIIVQTADNQVSVNYMEPSTWFLGYINPAQFSRPPHSEWYLKGFESYQPAQEVMDKLALTDKENLSIKIVMGTWCPDSRREVPRFMKILDLWGFPAEKVTYIGVDNNKIAPIGDYEKLGIERVPTFIILENKVETGRIIENPVTSLEQDMLNILTRNEK